MEQKGLDKNTLIGFSLIGAIVIFFYFWNGQQAPLKPEARIEGTEILSDSIQKVEEAPLVVKKDSTLVDTLKEQFVQIESNKLQLTFSTKGAQITQAYVKGYQTYDSLPLNLIDNSSLLSFSSNNKRSSDYFYSVEEKKIEGNSVVVFTSINAPTPVEITYSLPKEGYMISTSVRGIQSSGVPMNVLWNQNTLRQEKSLENEQYATTIGYLENGDDYDYLSERSNDSEDLSNLSWIAHKQQFFSSILTPVNGMFSSGKLTSSLTEGDEEITKVLVSDLQLIAEGNTTSFELYLGPNRFETLQAYNKQYEEIIPLGWGIFGWINKYVVIKVFNWLDTYNLNYGLIILIMTLMIKMVLFPFTYTSYKSMAKMRVLKPEIDEINEKFKDKDPMKKQQATMDLYRKTGVSPLGGCLPMLLQFPILIAIFRFFPSSIELRQQSFLWADDLSTYDSIYNLPFDIPFYGDHISLFTLLMTVSTLIYTWMNSQMTGSTQQMPQMKYIMYLMPIMFLGIFNNYAAGLSYYYFLANMITFGQQWIIRSVTDDEAIHAKLQENKKKPKKKSKFAARLEEMQKQSNNK